MRRLDDWYNALDGGRQFVVAMSLICLVPYVLSVAFGMQAWLPGMLPAAIWAGYRALRARRR